MLAVPAAVRVAEKLQADRMMTTIVIAEDHALVREGLKLLMSSDTSLSVAGEAGDGLEAVRLVEELKPDVLLRDLMMPRLNGIDVIRRIRRGLIPV